jgi:hypothetical protein
MGGFLPVRYQETRPPAQAKHGRKGVVRFVRNALNAARMMAAVAALSRVKPRQVRREGALTEKH